MVTAVVALLGVASAVLVIGVFASVLIQFDEIDHPAEALGHQHD